MTNKYTWTHIDMHKWMNEQSKQMKKIGIPISTAAVSKILYEKVIVPNNINLTELIVSKKIKSKKWKRIF